MYRMFINQLFVIWGKLLLRCMCWIAVLKYSNAMIIFFSSMHWDIVIIFQIVCTGVYAVAYNDYCKTRQWFVLIDP